MSAHYRSTESKARILIVDDHPIVRQGVAQLINSQPDLHLCCEAENAEQAFAAMEACRHDLAIVDISLPGLSGIELIKALKQRYGDFPVLVISMHEESVYGERALRAGAKGYIMKQEAIQSILQALRQILDGGIYLSPSMQTLILSGLTGNRGANGEHPVASLSDREFEILHLMGMGLTTNQIARQLNRSIKTIETHRAAIKIKLGIPSSSQLFKFAVQWVEKQV
ncbi:response regulator transcription factor [Methylococcus sp. EFPC2]|uniref:response regulator transcription factor n=1 Tax=Methylococcus sp. EFPC2 TaxID=2812648 RepID=UPI001967AF5F|nr:response regulator transcription factor [Methylococcus sp. EFPC2]QSA96113.1 response regulator transcription factor [Methylococcus sp. EFPC2]